MIVDAATAPQIGLAWLRAAVAPVGLFGRRHDDSVTAYGPGDEDRAITEISFCVDHAARLASDVVSRMRAALRAIPEPTPIAARARAGDPLTDVDFYELTRFGDAVDALAHAWDAAGGSDAARPRPVAGLQTLLAPGRTTQGFYLADAFSSELTQPRAALRAAEAEVNALRAQIVERVRSRIGIVPAGDEFAVLRDVYDGPLPDGVHVVREAPTYRLAALTLASVPRDTALTTVAAAEEIVRRELATAIAREADAIEEATHALGLLDRRLARIAFAQRWGACVPDLAPSRIACSDAVFGPLAESIGTRGHRYTSLSFDIAGVAVLTGPNMGGKSAALATAGFLCACVALGIPPPARSASLPLLERITWLGSDAPVPGARLLSSFANEVVAASDALARASSRSLVLIDEFARTTGPREGRALLVALLEELQQRGAFALAATHFDRVAAAARVTHLRIAGLTDSPFETLAGGELDAALVAINAAMDYRIVAADDAADPSDALALAQLLGLDANVVQRARVLYAREGERSEPER